MIDFPNSPTDGQVFTSGNSSWVWNAAASQWRTSLIALNPKVQRLSGDGTTVQFTLNSTPPNINFFDVYITGLYQQKNTYTLAGNVLTFSEAPPTGTENIEVEWGSSLDVGVPSDLSVGTDKLQDSSVTLVKLAKVGTAGQVLTSNGPSSAPSYQAVFPSGTALVFAQTAAPTGWTKSVTHNDKALRVVSGNAGSGGTSAFSTVFGSRTPSGSISVSGTVGDTTLSTAQIPSHTHTLQGYYNNGVSDSNQLGIFTNNNGLPRTTNGGSYANATGGGGSHNHSFSGSGSFTGSAMDFAVQYVDVIIATKD